MEQQEANIIKRRNRQRRIKYYKKEDANYRRKYAKTKEIDLEHRALIKYIGKITPNICKICNGNWHNTNVCGNIFMLNDFLEFESYGVNQIWREMKMKHLQNTSIEYQNYKKELYEKRSIYRTVVKAEPYDETEAKKELEELMSKMTKTYFCLFCGGKGHDWYHCGAKWFWKKQCQGKLFERPYFQMIEKWKIEKGIK